MNTYIGTFRIPRASMSVFDIVSISTFIILYDKFTVPYCIKLTKRELKIPGELQRIGVGLFAAAIAMIFVSKVVQKRPKYENESGNGNEAQCLNVLSNIMKGSIKTNWISRVEVGVYDHLDVDRSTIESWIRVLPTEKSSVSCNFVLQLLKESFMINIDPALSLEFERRAAEMLESCFAEGLMAKNYGDVNIVYDVELVTKMVNLI
ncbi:hypothetical protein NE237_002141 [Protea cynaroides]|uniref:NPH3 domain-containing protein n=1 Tax=Protea cynaroides TaxID=273540 RepID=A0A9Q0QYS1_9MAGN|nr:hypothetical protein NE237_002141 [Protea cynaroides]